MKSPKTKQQKFFRNYYFSFDIFKVDVVVLIGDPNEIVPFCKDNFPKVSHLIQEYLEEDPIKPNIEGRTFLLHGGASIIWLKDKNSSTLIHELFHAVFYMLKCRDTNLTHETEEVFAYSLEAIYNNLTRQIYGRSIPISNS